MLVYIQTVLYAYVLFCMRVRLLYDNAPVHTAAISKVAVRQCDFSDLGYLPYSLDLVPSYYFKIKGSWKKSAILQVMQP